MGDRTLEAVNVTRGTVVCARMLWAGTSETRRRGLLGRDALDPDEGLYIVPCKWIHMFGMRFPIDVAFLDAAGRVVAVHEALPPNRLSRIAWRADGVLELPAHRLARTGTRIGDTIEFRDAPEPE